MKGVKEERKRRRMDRGIKNTWKSIPGSHSIVILLCLHTIPPIPKEKERRKSEREKEKKRKREKKREEREVIINSGESSLYHKIF